MAKITLSGWAKRLEKPQGHSPPGDQSTDLNARTRQSVSGQFQCPSCGQKLNVPADRGSLDVRCPSCHHVFRWSPPEFEQVLFCCAQSGAEFVFTFWRKNKTEKFRIFNIVALNPIKSSPGTTSPSGPSSPRRSLNAKEFDVSGWKCPDCKHGGSGATTLFVKCGTCNNLVCGSKVITTANGQSTFQCTPVCGAGAVITGEIEEYDADPVLQKEPRHASATTRDKPLTKLTHRTKDANVKSLPKQR